MCTNPSESQAVGECSYAVADWWLPAPCIEIILVRLNLASSDAKAVDVYSEESCIVCVCMCVIGSVVKQMRP